MFLGMVSAIGQGRVVTFINEILKYLAIVDLGRGRLVLVDEFTFGINLSVVFITIVALSVLFGPTRIAVFLAFSYTLLTLPTIYST